eukprot:4155715-Pleurochrysis_carterae.AAC.2
MYSRSLSVGSSARIRCDPALSRQEEELALALAISAEECAPQRATASGPAEGAPALSAHPMHSMIERRLQMQVTDE